MHPQLTEKVELLIVRENPDLFGHLPELAGGDLSFVTDLDHILAGEPSDSLAPVSWPADEHVRQGLVEHETPNPGGRGAAEGIRWGKPTTGQFD